MTLERPKAWVQWVIRVYFVRRWQVDLHESLLPVEKHKSLFSFFYATLKRRMPSH